MVEGREAGQVEALANRLAGVVRKGLGHWSGISARLHPVGWLVEDPAAHAAGL